MINSRQIIELIKTERSRTTDATVRQAYTKMIEKIEVLEDIELTKMFDEYAYQDRERQLAAEMRHKQAASEFEKAFKF